MICHTAIFTFPDIFSFGHCLSTRLDEEGGDEEALVRKVTLPSEMHASLSIILVDVIVFWSILSSSSSLRDHDLST